MVLGRLIELTCLGKIIFPLKKYYSEKERPLMASISIHILEKNM
jgi:hypothetical protein